MERNHAKLAEAAKGYYAAMDERMSAAEGNLGGAPLRLAHLVAQFRCLNELLAAAYHRGAALDFDAVTALEATATRFSGEWTAAPTKTAAAADRGRKDDGDAVQARQELRQAVLQDLQRRSPKSCEGSCRRRGWVSQRPYHAVVRGGVLELYEDKDTCYRGLPPAEAFRLDKVDFVGETRPGASKR